MKLGLVGPSYQARSLPFNAQRCVNLYPVSDEGKQGAEVSALYGTPGLLTFATVGSGSIRGAFVSTSGRAFVVSGQELYEIFADGTSLLLSFMNTTEGACTFAENASELAVCDSSDLKILTYADNTVVAAVLPFPEAPLSVTFQDQYFIVNRAGTGEFYVSGLGDGLTWNALDFATAESSPDSSVRVYSAYGQLFIYGRATTEAWYNSGAADFPFARVGAAKMENGLAAAATVLNADNSVFWLGQDRDGRGVVYRAQGYTPQRISTSAIEKKLQEAASLESFRAYSYQEDGHLFYVLTGGGLDTTLVYDMSTKLWHERAYLRSDGQFSAHRSSCHIFAFGKHLVGDRENAKVYEQSLAYYDDDGQETLRQRTFSHLTNENRRFSINYLDVFFEAGVGLTSGQGSDPLAILQTSADGGKNWSDEMYASIGKIGETDTRAVWRKLGQFKSFTARVSISDPVKVAIIGAYSG